MQKLKRTLAVHDISCFGKCSLTVALPVISACGVEVTALPTAVLSTHTGGFTGYTFRDLTSDVRPIADHWKTVGIDFDAIYTGYLGSFEQIELVSSIIDEFKKENTLVVVDPVMADNGKLYASFPSDFPQGMKKLCRKADVIVPNMTEALFMLEKPYVEGPYTKEFIERTLSELCALGVKTAVLTGVYLDGENLGAACMQSDGKVSYAFEKRIPEYYHGTGDVFASVLTGALVSGASAEAAVQAAVKFTVESLRRSYEEKTDTRFGVDFEHGLAGLPELIASVR